MYALASAVAGVLTFVLLSRGFAADAAALFDAHSLGAQFAGWVATWIGEPSALRLIFVFGTVLSTMCLLFACGSPWVAPLAILAAPVTTGFLHGDLAALAVGPAALGIRAWKVSTFRGFGATLLLATLSPVAAVALAVAGFVLRPGPAPLLLAPLLATFGESGAIDAVGLANFRAVTAGTAGGVTAGAALALGLALMGGPLRLRLAGLAAAALALGPVWAFTDAQGHMRAFALPSFLFAELGAAGGWSGAGAVAAAALALAMSDARPARALPLAALIVLEGAAVAAPIPTRLPEHPREAVASLAERSGTILHLPVGLASQGDPARAALWRHESRVHRRQLYADAHAVQNDDPVLGEPGVVAVLGLLQPSAGWLIPPTEAGAVLRSLGITELVLDRAALNADDLARLDPVLAHLYGPPQRDNAGGIDLWRTATVGTRRLASPPHLRRRGEPGSQGWRTLEEALSPG